MARKKVVVTAVADDGMLESVDVDACGHINRHYTAGFMSCDLPKNHNGDHEADYPNGRAHWKDAAGKNA